MQQFTVLYMRDINDDYMKQLDLVMRHVADSSGVVTLNVSQNLCVSGSGLHRQMRVKNGEESIDTYIDRISQGILFEKDRENFCRQFCRENMMKCFEKGENPITMEQYYSSVTRKRI